VKAGRSLDSSMGFSPLDGLVMSTRCGSLDPGVVLFLQLVKGLSAREVEDMLYHRSGLLGVSGLSGDMRVLLQSAEPAARAAIELFAFRAAREAGALASSLEGLDGIVFTGGIGENAAAIRTAVAARLRWLGLELDESANSSEGERLISPPASRVRAWVLAADEEAVIAGDCAALLSSSC
jgi:acetate kinase